MNGTFGQTLYTLRKHINESQEQVAAAVDISTVAYTRYENDQREPKASVVIRLAQHFGVTVESLYGIESNKDFKPRSLGENRILEIYSALSADKRSELLQYAEYMLFRQTDEKGSSGAAI